tara:strand:- start:107 stop:355 length:249 start_codon:yes stop_codon:yes gene_type:complete
MEWVEGQGQHPKKGVLETREATHPTLGKALLYPTNRAMGMWVVYLPEVKGTPQHFLGVFPEEGEDEWAVAIRKAEARLEKVD